ncbi:MAG TPA: flagellar brake protein [Burkholderiaceae bacterium]|nr:flagellar brake protein [Burkholderiaceae bacterium]
MAQPAFVDTQPAPMSALSGQALDDYRIDDPTEAQALLRRLVDQGTLIHLSAPGNAAYTSVLWAVDPKARRVSLDADPAQPAVRALVDAGDATAVAYLDAIKLQFELGDLMLVHGSTGSALQASWPATLYRFQRRSSFRVRARSGACAQMRHPALPEMALALRVVDVSLGGCALLLPANVPALDAGITLARVRIELDADTHFDTSITVQHVSGGFGGAAEARRLGCAFGTLDGPAQRALQRFIDVTQRRQRMLSA